MATQYFIITRFNLPLHWPPDHEVPPGWLERRFELFEQFCFPSVNGQEDRNFTWLVLFSDATPEAFRARIRGYQERCAMFKPVFLPPDERESRRAFLVSERYAEALDPFLEDDAEFVVTTRLDSDDALHRTFVARLRRHAVDQDLEVFNFPVGYYLDVHTNATFRVVDERGTNTISFLERRRPEERFRTVYIFDRHTEAGEHRRVNQVPGGPGWIMVTHDRTIMNDISWAHGLGGQRVTFPEKMFAADFNVWSSTVPGCHIRDTRHDILVVTPVPTHPQDYGNRKRIYRMCRALQNMDARVHLLHYPAEHRWWDRIPLEANQAMQRQWDSYYLVHPTRPRHAAAAAEDHFIDEWWDESVGDYLDWLCGVQAFDMVIVHYTWMSRALLHVPDNVLKVIDTHDLVGGRRGILDRAGIEAEFFHTTDEEEGKGLRRANLVLGIKDQETRLFSEKYGVEAQTLVHCDPESNVGELPWSGKGDRVTIGFIGAHNSFNRVALGGFLDAAAERIRRAGNIRLVIAGTVTDYFQDRAEPFIELMPLEGSVESFYRRVDLVVVPMRVSTGFKIKVAEALSYGRPLVATAHATEGIPTDFDYHRCRTIDEVIDKCLEVAAAPQKLPEMASASRQVHRRLLVDYNRQLQTLLGKNLPTLAVLEMSRNPGVLQLERQREIIKMIAEWWRLVLFVHRDGGRNHRALSGFHELNAIYDTTIDPPRNEENVQIMSWEQLQQSARLTLTWVEPGSGLVPSAGLRVEDAVWGEVAGARSPTNADGADTVALVSVHDAPSGATPPVYPVMFFVRPPRTCHWQAPGEDRTVAVLADRWADVALLYGTLRDERGRVELLVFTRADATDYPEGVTVYGIDPLTADLPHLPVRPDVVIDAAGRRSRRFAPLREYVAWSAIPVLVRGEAARLWDAAGIEHFATGENDRVADRVAALLDDAELRRRSGQEALRVLKEFIEENSRVRQLRFSFEDRRRAES